jgi:hypothetical protein
VQRLLGVVVRMFFHQLLLAAKARSSRIGSTHAVRCGDAASRFLVRVEEDVAASDPQTRYTFTMPYHHTYLTLQPVAAYVKTHAAHGFEEEVPDVKTSRRFVESCRQ